MPGGRRCARSAPVGAYRPRGSRGILAQRGSPAQHPGRARPAARRDRVESGGEVDHRSAPFRCDRRPMSDEIQFQIRQPVCTCCINRTNGRCVCTPTRSVNDRILTNGANTNRVALAGEIGLTRVNVAPAPKEQPPRKLSGTRTAHTVNTLESGAHCSRRRCKSNLDHRFR